MSNLIPIEYQSQRILTTAQLAESYGADTKLISQNFSRNETRYKAGKHYFKLEGNDLEEFKKSYPQFEDTLKFVSILYLWPEKGAWLHAKSLNTDKAWEAYEMLVDDYYAIKQSLPLPKETLPNEPQRLRAEAMLLNAKTRQAKMMKETAIEFQSKLSDVSLHLLIGGITEILMGKSLLPLPTIEKTYSATDIGNELGVSSNRIGKIANRNNLKTDEYGITVLDKSPYSTKQIPSFRYNEKGRERLIELVGGSE